MKINFLESRFLGIRIEEWRLSDLPYKPKIQGGFGHLPFEGDKLRLLLVKYNIGGES